MAQFIEPVIDRTQHLMFYPTLDEAIPADHPVRAFDLILDTHDWAAWESQYSNEGQRPFPPAMMAKLLVYAYSRGVRSSRQIEEACRSRMDFVFLTSGRAPDLAAASRRGDTTRSARFGVGTRRS